MGRRTTTRASALRRKALPRIKCESPPPRPLRETTPSPGYTNEDGTSEQAASSQSSSAAFSQKTSQTTPNTSPQTIPQKKASRPSSRTSPKAYTAELSPKAYNTMHDLRSRTIKLPEHLRRYKLKINPPHRPVRLRLILKPRPLLLKLRFWNWWRR